MGRPLRPVSKVSLPACSAPGSSSVSTAGCCRPAGVSTCTTRSPSLYCSWHSPQESAESMENRKQAILRAVVHEFTTSAVPVGSQALQSRYFVNLSSATIRSELAELADLGYLAQPHTSAGRGPPHSRDRYLVDLLVGPGTIPGRVPNHTPAELEAAPGGGGGKVGG